MHASLCAVRVCVALTLAFVLLGAAAVSARALDVGKDEKEQLEACERELCTIVVKREAGGDLQCSMQKTWAGSKIKQGVEEKKLTWSLGDVRCSTKLEAKRQEIVDALTKPQFEWKLPAHKVQCEVEREKEVLPISVALAPRIQFKDGKAAKVWLGIGEIQAPAVVKGAIWTAAQLEDTFGVVHSDLIKEINRFVYERCPKRLAK
ncbi:MAG: hypothetical protein HC868_14505 [Sphingomonadales bacterium]|nr:hypothetical protein [Sphingomonadales bacterium]